MKTMYSDREKCALSREQRSDKIRLANFVKLKVKGQIFKVIKTIKCRYFSESWQQEKNSGEKIIHFH